MNRKAITIIAATIAAFSLNAASCEQLVPTPAVEQIVTFQEVDPAPCGIAGVQTLEGCLLPDPVTPQPQEPCTEGLCGPAQGMDGRP